MFIFLLCVLLQTRRRPRFASGLLVDEFGFNLISMALTSVFPHPGQCVCRRTACGNWLTSRAVISMTVFGGLLMLAAKVAIGELGSISWHSRRSALGCRRNWFGGRRWSRCRSLRRVFIGLGLGGAAWSSLDSWLREMKSGVPSILVGAAADRIVGSSGGVVMPAGGPACSCRTGST